MTLGIPAETKKGERLVAASPKTVGQLVALGYEVIVQSGAGQQATFTDEDYADAGATVGDAKAAWRADIVTAVNAPGKTQLAKMRKGSILISMMSAPSSPDYIADLAERGITGMALDAVPRISRAQSMDVLSTMSNVAGYRAVIEAAENFGGMFTGQVTAAGKTPPAHVFVIGAGVAGLAAIGTAASLGAQVRAFDVRPEVGEQIESMGATFVQAEAAQQEVSSDGYAKELSKEQEALTAAMYAEESAKADVVITTALVRGKAVRTISAEMVAAMKPGSVIIDLAAIGGGNCELTVPGERIVTDNGVTIVGYTDLTSRMPQHTSQLFGTNIVNVMKLMTPGKDGTAVLNFDDEVVRGMTVAHAGEVMWPPPPVNVSAAAAAEEAPSVPPATSMSPEEQAKVLAEAAAKKATRRMVTSGIAAALVVLAVSFSPLSFVSYFTIFALAVVVGFYVISGVSHSLHTPLMAQTNAISGIILVGALLQLGSTNIAVLVMSFVAAAIASINIFGGFLVSYRMLGMFRKEA
ncbi:Re/Si-specific NAD(P)(+) transhydrogenase subunit alpha [Demequina sp. TTPB684]|uniref:Re/Si-specific NAD(P)(+) transhydrogenase subunit alpha n=1 Tax=unclassified Demequina TaxID=2620311 RepID=UPI001CF4C210|nr:MULTISPECIES: Re/Si-specific NAD(P)(+) transhydrogenase subunit alpha [unclassified Demequina]MCB2414037.1 Re/Si-specific NAD(P)(+) transhydrogenase subunit alpha [Demequina sp. TTPB684]UPU89700.1 Re/Si-specific NAD(P)(+) transhydrogenase subunit alpha [Demequina sp. TMPB413]